MTMTFHLEAQTVKNLPAMQEFWVRSLGQGDLLEKHVYPLQYFRMENSMGRGAKWAIVNGITKSWTRLTLSAGRVNIFCESSYRSICLERHPN